MDSLLESIHILLCSKHCKGAGIVPALKVHIIDKPDGGQFQILAFSLLDVTVTPNHA